MNIEEEWAKQDRLRALNAHYHIAVSKVVPGIVNEALIAELQDIALSFEQFITEGLPGFADVNQVWYKIAHCKERIAFIYSMRGELRQARNCYEEAKRIFAEISNTMMVENCQESLRSLLMRGEGNVDEEIQHLYVALAQSSPGSLDHVQILSDLGSLLVTAGDDFAAKEYLHTAEHELEDMRYHFPSAQELQIHYQQAMRELSTEESAQWMLFQRVASLYRQIYQALIRIYERTAPERAGEYSERIELLNRDGFDPLTYEQHLQEIARLVQEFEEKVLRREAEEDLRQKEQRQKDIQHQKKFDSVLEQMNQAIAQAKGQGQDVTLPQELLGQLDVLVEESIAEAHRLINEDRSIHLGDSTDVVKDNQKHNLVDPLRLRQELDALYIENVQRPAEQSRDDLLQRLTLLEAQARRMGNPESIAASLLYRADILMKLQRDQEALETLQEAQNSLGEVGRYSLEVYIVERRARIYARSQDWHKVSSTCEAGIQLVEKHRYQVTGQYMQSSYLRSRISLYTLGVRSAYLIGDYTLMLERAELSKSRFSLRYHRQVISGETEEQTLQQFQLVQKEIEEARAGGLPQEELLSQRRLLWELLEIERFHARSREQLLEFSLPQVQSTLDIDEAILYYYWLDRESLLIVTIDRQDFVPELRHVNQAQYRELEQLALTALTQRSGKELMQLEAILLFSSLLLPQRGLPLLERKQRLLLSPHKILHTLPLHALEWGEDVLIQHFAVTYIPNLGSLLLQYSANRETSFVLALGIRDYAVPNHQVISLFDAEQEVEDVARIYEAHDIPVTVLRGGAANQQQMQLLAARGLLEQYSCLHFATHGENIDSDTPMESYLYLSDSILEGLTIANWRLHADVVVLSACSSGQRPIAGRDMDELPGDELFGLQAAFFAAGARCLLCSLWGVDSPTARKITTSFHRYLASGERPELALQAALKDYLSTAGPLTRKIYYWAPFFLSTLGRPRADVRGE